ncbi:MAG: PEP-CTERM sorting domain-containing protein [Rhodospirillaceae bacterium]|jgi:hypothetical protein|nr:PEP-CTERM sorting domain-containing protein [Rhodospirillaceae bacterium]
MFFKSISKIAILSASVCAFALSANTASAHTVTIGYENAGTGSVNFWYGSYHGFNGSTEGSLNLVGINGNSFASTTVAYSLASGTQAAGLIDNVTNFVDPTYSTGFAGVNSWQGVNFTGLQAGDYQFTYVPIGSPSAHWAPWSNNILSGTVSLTEEIVQAVPEPAPLALFGLGLIGLTVVRRKRAK